MNKGVRTAANIIRMMKKADNDFVIAISGARGLGKSTLQIKFIYELNGQKWPDYNEVLVFNKSEFEEKLKTFPDNSIIGSDEAVNALYKREWQKGEQTEIVKTLNVYRDKCHTIFLLIPHLWDLDSGVRNSMIIKWWIFVYKIGEAVVWAADTNPFNQDPWNIKLNTELYRRGQLWKSPNYLFNVTWPEMPEAEYNKYKAVKAEKRKYSKDIEAVEKENEVKASYTFMAAEAMRFNETLTVRQAAKMFNITPESLHAFLKRRQILEAEYNPELKKTKITSSES